MGKTAIILGATGLTGGILLEKLLKDRRYDSVTLFSRSPVKMTNPKIKEHLIDLFQLEKHSTDFIADEVFCCVGTTNAKTPDKELYRNIDYGIPVSAAKLCRQNGISTFIVISALGADTKSRVFYNRTKGDMEEAVLKFQIPKTYLLQPSLIGGHRMEKRLAEYFFKQLMKIINPILVGSLQKYRTISPDSIANTMIWLANNEFPKHRVTSEEIKKLSSVIR